MTEPTFTRSEVLKIVALAVIGFNVGLMGFFVIVELWHARRRRKAEQKRAEEIAAMLYADEMPDPDVPDHSP